MEKSSKKAKTYLFNSNSRKHTLFSLNTDDLFIFLKTGIKMEIEFKDKRTFASTFSRVDKNIRTFMYNKSIEYDMSQQYIVDLKVPTTIMGRVKSSFVSLNVMFENKFGSDIKKNEPFAKEILEYFYQQMKRFEPEEIFD